jgi:hypothetical protein
MNGSEESLIYRPNWRTPSVKDVKMQQRFTGFEDKLRSAMKPLRHSDEKTRT